MDYLICKGCNTKVAKPVLCTSCGIASHPGCLNRTGHPVLNGKCSDCSLAFSSSIPHNPNDSQLINNFRLFKHEIEEALTERFNVFEKKILDFINNLRSEINSEIDGIKKRDSAPEHLVPVDPYHPPLHFSLPLVSDVASSRSYLFKKDFIRADYASINNHLCSINWDDALSNLSVNESVELLQSHLEYSIDLFVPTKLVRKSSYPSWFSSELIRCIKLKKSAHTRFKRYMHFSDYLMFTKLRSDCKALSHRCWRNYVNRVEDNIPGNIKTFWKFSNSSTKSNARPTTMHLNNVLLDDDISIANGFAQFFESVYSSDSDYTQTFNSKFDLNISHLDIKLRASPCPEDSVLNDNGECKCLSTCPSPPACAKPEQRLLQTSIAILGTPGSCCPRYECLPPGHQQEEHQEGQEQQQGSENGCPRDSVPSENEGCKCVPTCPPASCKPGERAIEVKAAVPDTPGACCPLYDCVASGN
ncbi:hypothetical protein KPH14_010937 [Odynerus spinipes]|uniref:Uncharacterized protein n=1 Tax=Odynerus spinipes TaxID=1348599 RepID=A0AAD9RG80_9HYME|nr:hypothetical protein KPH14_010937 [Odynerus spinipes]